MDLSILIPARNEIFLKETIEDIVRHREADTEVIAVLDGEWPHDPIPQMEHVNIIKLPEAIGQRAAQNLACRLSRAKYVMKVDAHCSFDQGFDKKMIDFMDSHGDVTAVPVMRNLWAFDWKCFHCGWKKYQGPTPEKCGNCGKTDRIKRKMIWKGKESPQSTSYCFDQEPHFQYHQERKHTKEYKIGAIIGYKISIDFSLLSSNPLSDVVLFSDLGDKPPTLLGVVDLLANLARSHQFTVLPNSSRLWKDVTSNAVGFPSINNGRGFGVQNISFIRNESEMQRIAALPVLTDVINYGYILTSSSGDRSNKPGVSKTVCEGFLSEMGAPTVTPTINSSLPNPTTRRVLHSDMLDKFNCILGGEFVYSEKRKSFHNGSVSLIPIHSNTATETMSLQGSAFMVSRENYWKWEVCDEKAGSWGNQGIEVALATWFNGGRVLCNHNTWYAHMFRTQGGDFGFPYENKGGDVDRTKKYIKEKYINNPKLKDLLDKFSPVPGWEEYA